MLVAYGHVSGIGKVRKEIGGNVRRYRNQAGLSQERLAEQAELHPVHIEPVARRLVYHPRGAKDSNAMSRP